MNSTAPAGLDVLKTGELTLCDLSVFTPSGSDWDSCVRERVTAALMADVPVVYVECGGFDDTASERLRVDNGFDRRLKSLTTATTG